VAKYTTQPKGAKIYHNRSKLSYQAGRFKTRPGNPQSLGWGFFSEHKKEKRGGENNSTGYVSEIS